MATTSTKKIKNDKNGDNVIQNPSPYNPKKNRERGKRWRLASYHIISY